LNPTQKFWTNKLPLALRQANNPPRTERNQASIENKVAFRDKGSRQTEESLPAKGELNRSPDGYPLQRRKQEDDEDAYESRQEARTGALQRRRRARRAAGGAGVLRCRERTQELGTQAERDGGLRVVSERVLSLWVAEYKKGVPGDSLRDSSF